MRRMRFIALFTARELWRSRSAFLQMMILSSFAMSGFFAAEQIHDSLNSYIASTSKNFLGADIIISSRNDLSDEKIQQILKKFPDDIRHSENRSFYTMAAFNGQNALTEVYAVDDAFPLYGTIRITGNAAGSYLSGQTLGSGGIVVYPELLLKINATVGSSILIGQKTFKIMGTINAEDTSWFGEASFAPRIYMNVSHLAETSLLKTGSISWRRLLVAFSQNHPSEEALKQISQNLEEDGFHVSTLASGENRTLALLEQMTQYLRVSALIAIFVLLISITYLYRDHLERGIKNWAILANLGLNFRLYFSMSLLKLLVTVVLGGIVGIFLALPLSKFFAALMLKNFGIQIPLVFDLLKAIKSIFIIFVTCLLVNLPFFWSLRAFNLKVLLGEHLPLDFSKASAVFSAIFIGLSIFTFALVYSTSTRVGLVFALGFVLCIFLLVVASLVAMKSLNFFAEKSSLKFKLAILNLTRQKTVALWTLSATILAVFLITLPEQLASNIKGELGVKKNALPSLFLFDIQEEQVAELQGLLQQSHLSPQLVAPMIRARLNDVNGEDLTQKIEQMEKWEREKVKRMLKRGYNLSYRSSPDPSETVVAGSLNLKVYDEKAQQLPEISLEKRFAERYNMNIGDVLHFDVQGVSIRGRVTSIRSVRWTSFQPNFFILIQPGVLEEAPKTYLATLPALAAGPKNDIQKTLAQHMPNVSSIDVSHLVAKVSSLIGALQIFFQVSFTLAALSGFFLVLAIVSRKTQRFVHDFNLLKMLGVSDKSLIGINLWQNFFISTISLAIGIFLSLAMSRQLSSQLFGSSVQPDLQPLMRFSIMFLVFFMASAYIILWVNMRVREKSKSFSSFLG